MPPTASRAPPATPAPEPPGAREVPARGATAAPAQRPRPLPPPRPPTITTPLAPTDKSPRRVTPLAAPAASSFPIGHPSNHTAPNPLPTPTLRLSRSPGSSPARPAAAPHRVVGEEPGVIVQHEPAVLPALHDIGPFAQRALHDRRHLRHRTGTAATHTPPAR